MYHLSAQINGDRVAWQLEHDERRHGRGLAITFTPLPIDLTEAIRIVASGTANPGLSWLSRSPEPECWTLDLDHLDVANPEIAAAFRGCGRITSKGQFVVKNGVGNLRLLVAPTDLLPRTHPRATTPIGVVCVG